MKLGNLSRRLKLQFFDSVTQHITYKDMKMIMVGKILKSVIACPIRF